MKLRKLYYEGIIMKKIVLAAILMSISKLCASEVKNVNFHQKEVSLFTVEEVATSLQKLSQKSQYNLDLSDNYIDDDSLETLLNTIETGGLSAHIQVLDLTNNRLTLQSLLRLIPLITQDTLQWLVVPINCLDVNDMRNFMDRLSDKARDAAIVKGLASDTFFNKWIEKVIWLPKTFNFAALLSEPQRAAHARYYQK
jgi:hypothetical protein